MLNLLKNLFKKEAIQVYEVTYRWIGDEETETTTASSGGLAAMEADPMIEILKVD